jgi:hypothetical protein
LERDRQESAALQHKLMQEREELRVKMQNQMEYMNFEDPQLHRQEKEDVARSQPQQQAHSAMANGSDSHLHHTPSTRAQMHEAANSKVV